MSSEFLKQGAKKFLNKMNSLLNPFIRDPEETSKIFNAMLGYSVMLTMGCVSKSLMAKLVTWIVLFVWTLVRAFKLADIVHPIDAAKLKGPSFLSYHLGALLAFLVSGI